MSVIKIVKSAVARAAVLGRKQVEKHVARKTYPAIAKTVLTKVNQASTPKLHLACTEGREGLNVHVPHRPEIWYSERFVFYNHIQILTGYLLV